MCLDGYKEIFQLIHASSFEVLSMSKIFLEGEQKFSLKNHRVHFLLGGRAICHSFIAYLILLCQWHANGI